MELRPIIEFLTRRRAALDETIACLERLSVGNSPGHVDVTAKRRGRKSMDEADRQKVSARMKEYWAARRSDKAGHAGGAY